MSRFKYSLYTVLITFTFCGAAASQESVELATFNQIMQIMGEHYYDSKFNGLDSKQISEETREGIKDASTSKERYKLISNQLKKLGHSHLAFQPPVEEENKKKVTIPYGNPKERDFNLEFISGNWLVTHVAKESEAWKAGLRPGQSVLKLNKWKTTNAFSGKDPMDYYMLKMTLENYPSKNIKLTVKKDDETNIYSKIKRLAST